MIATNYLVIAGVSIMCLLVIIIHLQESELFPKWTVRRFQFMAIITIIAIVIDATFFILEGKTNSPTFFMYVLKAIEFSLNAFIILIAVEILCKGRKRNKKDPIIKIKMIVFGACILNVVIQFITIFGHFIFTIDEQNYYQRTNFTWIYVGFLLLCILMLIAAIRIYSIEAQSLNQMTILGFLLVFSTGFVIRALLQKTNFDWLCMVLSFLILCLYYYNVTMKLDALTNLLNRHAYEYMVNHIDFTTVIIMIDTNNLKGINDNYGHECGDKVLKLFAKCILKTYKNYAYCYRIGGDEFCVILKPGVFNQLIEEMPRCDVYTMCEEFMTRLDETINKYKERDPENNFYLTYGVSQGYGIYKAPSDHPSVKENMPLTRVIHLADMRMYHQKAEFKKKLEASGDKIKPVKGNKNRPKVKYKPTDPELIEDSGLE
jgi:diguanylate cyclase (GGDEF)-like protein